MIIYEAHLQILRMIPAYSYSEHYGGEVVRIQN